MFINWSLVPRVVSIKFDPLGHLVLPSIKSGLLWDQFKHEQFNH
jgi:hypothetical protein